jgi:outer membrane receptor protein involved in Fe transport
VGRGDPGGPYYQSNKEIAFFVQDDWKVNPDLTLNLGLRYDIFTAPTERFDLQSNFVEGSNTIQMAGGNAPGGRDLADTDKNNFGPRIGFAYSGFKDDKRLVLRGGYGLLYATDTSAAQPLTANPGTGAGNYQCQPITNPGECPAFFLARNPFDRGVPVAPFTVQAPGTSFPAPPGSAIRFNDPNRKDEMYHQYNLTWQYEFAPNWLAEAAYVGSLGRNLLVLQNIGTGNDQGGPGAREVLTNSVVAQRYIGSSRYDSLQTKLEKRFVKGLSILGSYTWAHAIDDSPGGICSNGAGARDCGPDDPLRPGLEHASADTDVRHRFTFSDVWDLPFGRGRRFGTDMNRGVDAVVGGWQFNNIVVWQSGPVFNVTCDGGRVDLIGDPNPTQAQRDQGLELNRAAFRCSTTRVFATDPPFSQALNNRTAFPNIGTLGRNVLRGRPQFYWDASFFKNFPISAISEEFNVLNRVNRSSPKSDFNNENEFGRDLSEQRRRQMEFSLKLIF